MLGSSGGGEIELVLRYPRERPLRFIGDAGRIRQVLTNLAGNAIKFTARGHVSIDVEYTRNRAGRTRTGEVRISVQDTGIGIPAGTIDAIFEKFSQTDASTTREYGGSGWV
jgi:signal transduction histidine kinase